MLVGFFSPLKVLEGHEEMKGHFFGNPTLPSVVQEGTVLNGH